MPNKLLPEDLTPEQINTLYNRFQNRDLSSKQAMRFLKFVNDGDIVLPEGSTLDIPVLDPEIAAEYRSGKMSLEQQGQLQIALDKGVIKLPEEKGFLEKIAGFSEMITGERRKTPESETLPNLWSMPEVGKVSFNALKAIIATASTDPNETSKIIQNLFPNIKVRQDEKGNNIYTSAKDGKEYIDTPGFQQSDLLRGLLTGLEYYPAGKTKTILGQTLAAGATETAIQAGQKLAGGEFDVEQVGMAAGGAGALAAGGKVISAGNLAVQRAYKGFRGKPLTPLPKKDIVEITKKAVKGNKHAIKELAERVAPDPKVIAAAKRLGIDEYLQPDHITTNQQFREMAQSIKSVQSSPSRKLEIEGYEAIGKRADDLITEIGGTTDLSKLDKSIKASFKKVHSELDNVGTKTYKIVEDGIPDGTPTPATNIISFIENKIKSSQGRDILTPLEKEIHKKLKIIKGDSPNFFTVNEIRKKIGRGLNKQGEYKDEARGLLKKLYKEILSDQRPIAEKFGLVKEFDLYRSAIKMRKGIEDDITSLFGKQFNRDLIEGNLNTKLTTATKKLAEGDVSKMKALLETVPEDIKQDVFSSGIATAFNKSAIAGKLNFNTFSNWYEGIMKNSEARKFLLSNLPKDSRKRLSDLYRVSKAISKSTKERITTGKTMADRLRRGDSFMYKVYDFVKRDVAPTVIAEGVGRSLGFPFLGAGLAAGFRTAVRTGSRAKKDIILAADELLKSPAFVSAVHSGNAKQFSKTRAWKTFFNAMGRPRELSNPEQWILSAFQAGKNIKGDE